MTETERDWTDPETFCELLVEVGDYIRQSRGPSLYMGSKAVMEGILSQYRDDLVNALTADWTAPLSDSLIERVEDRRKQFNVGRVLIDRLMQRLESHEGCLDARDRNAIADAKTYLGVPQ